MKNHIIINNFNAEECFTEIKNYIEDMEKIEPSQQQVLALKEDIINFTAQMCANYINKIENQSDILTKLEKQTTAHSLSEQILHLTKV